ncbi:DUF1802 family protein [bacterium]|nr:MAG: DUF1802 family protein [bacterium]
MPETVICNIALKEWAITCEALAQGRQVILLRKGGLLDEDGTFSLEHGQFFLLPTYLHQEEGLVKPEHRDLFRSARKMEDESLRVGYLRHFARVEAVWQLTPDDEENIKAAPHIWSDNYLDVRFGYKSEKPLLCAALRIWELDQPVRYELADADMGCRSWITMSEPVEGGITVALSDEQILESVDELSEIFR